jgi:phenylalanyl-tRNA synthetase beta chain
VLVPLSWLRDFAPFPEEPGPLAAALDDLGLVVEGTEVVGEGLVDVVVVRVEEIAAIDGADRIRRVVVHDGAGPVEVVCGAWNFDAGDLVALAPVGSVLPGGFAIGRRKMKGVVSNGMLCSGRELRLSDDHEGILKLTGIDGARPGLPLTEVLGIEPDVIFDIAVEANRPDAWCMAGVARDLAARLGLSFTVPVTSALPPVVNDRAAAAPAGMSTDGPPVDTLTTVRVDDLDLCPRLSARVVTGIDVGPSPSWMARRLTLAGMRPINNVVDASNYVMLELGQPTHPYDLDRLPGQGLVVRRAEPGETLVTLDGVTRQLGRPGPGLGDTGQDCLICDAEGSPVGIGGIMGGESSEIGESTRRVLLESAYFLPMAIARTSKRLGLRTEASARFERGCDPAGTDRAATRFCELLALTGGAGMAVASGTLDVRGTVPAPVEMTVRTTRINALLGTDLSAEDVSGLLAPLGIGAEPAAGGDGESLRVTVPTYRPDIRPAPLGQADIAEEVARTYGYSRIARRTPSWPQPGRLTPFQRERRLLKDVVCGTGAHEAWTTTFVTEDDQVAAGFPPPYVEVTNPLVESERFLRASMAPGLIRAVLYNTERRQGDLRLFEVGSVFHHPGGPAPDPDPDAPGAGTTSDRLCVILAGDGDDAWSAVATWRTIADALRLDHSELGEVSLADPAGRALHPHRSASVWVPTGEPAEGPGAEGPPNIAGVLGELHPSLVGELGLVNPDGRPRRVGWVDLDLGVLLDPARTPRRPDEARPVTRFPSSDIDLAFVVDESVPALSVERTLRHAGGTALESVELFDVYRGPSIGDGARSLAFRLRFSALDHTLDDEETGRLRSVCIEAVTTGHAARLR